MPQLVIQTNLRLSQIPVNFNEKTTELLAELQNKPSSMTLISIQPNQLITFGGTNEPCALISLQSIGNISLDENRLTTKILFKHFAEELNISPKRIFLNFLNFNSENVAWNGKIFKDIFDDKDLDQEQPNQNDNGNIGGGDDNNEIPLPPPPPIPEINEPTTEQIVEESQ